MEGAEARMSSLRLARTPTGQGAVRAGEPLSGRTHLHDIYDKSGRSGRMIFLVSRMELFDKAGLAEGADHDCTSKRFRVHVQY